MSMSPSLCLFPLADPAGATTTTTTAAAAAAAAARRRSPASPASPAAPSPCLVPASIVVGSSLSRRRRRTPPRHHHGQGQGQGQGQGRRLRDRTVRERGKEEEGGPSAALPATLAVSAASALLYANSVCCGFAFDDVAAVLDNRDLRPGAPLARIFSDDFWGTPMDREGSHKSYRPLTVLTFRLQRAAAGGADPAHFHAANAAMHAAAAALFHRLCLALLAMLAPATAAPAAPPGLRSSVALVAGLLFAAHPVHKHISSNIRSSST